MRRVGPGDPESPGLTLVAGGANVAVHSAHADRIEVCLFDASGQAETERIALPERTGDVFHGFIPGINAGDRYGLRAHGPYDPAHGHRFNPAKLLVDPYATALDRGFALHPSLFGEMPDGVTRNDADSATALPKAIALPRAAAVPDTRPRVPWSATILYELHVRGYTKAHPRVPATLRGTCAGLAHPAALDHLVRLGITTVELMPVAAWIDEPHLGRQGLSNYWGYNPAAWLAVDPRLAPGGQDELRTMIAALHAAGIEVVLDVVFNHTGEGDERGPTLSLRGLDNATYYRLAAGAPARYGNDTGCGNTLALDRAPVLRLAMDALRQYAAMGVDGFRFDLATTLGRRADGFDPSAPLLLAIAQDPVLSALKLVAEPWDIGRGGYQLGAFPAGWGEWNDRYRDTVRRFWYGDRPLVAELATRVAGSADVFAARRRPPSRSINFLTAHDGFTLADLVAYRHKRNAANGEDNRDGTDANLSWNCGVEGPTTDPAVLSARERDMRSLVATLLLSRGTPMLAMGDERQRTQHGNNNAYAQDNALTWQDWGTAGDAFTGYVAALIRLRRRHPALGADAWLAGAPVDDSGIADVAWRHPDGREMSGADWNHGDAQALVVDLYQPPNRGRPADRVALAFNAGTMPLVVVWPEPRPGHLWRQAVDTAHPTETAAGAGALAGDSTQVAPRAVVVLEEEKSDLPRARRKSVAPDVLARLAVAAGIAPDWWDLAGQRHEVGAATTHALLDAMGLDVRSTGEARERLAHLAAARERRRLPAVAVVRDGATPAIAIATNGGPRRIGLRLRREDGSETPLACDLDNLPANSIEGADGRVVLQRMLALPALPQGYHTLVADDAPDAPCRIVVAPSACYVPLALRDGGRRFGVATHLYTLRRRDDHGIGDFTALEELALATAHAGGSIVGINPLHALFAAERERASPYHPSDRRFLDPIYIDVERIPDFRESRAARNLVAANAAQLAVLRAGATIDYPGVWAVKSAVLDACFAAFLQRGTDDPLALEFERFVAAGGDALRDFALFEAIAARHPRTPWHQWPAGLRSPRASACAAFARAEPHAIRPHLYRQWLADRQLGAAAATARAGGLTLGLYRDLAVGVAPDGAEAWADTGGSFARGASVGAPPDPFSATGQNWGLPPPVPGVLTSTGYRSLQQLAAANMRHAGALRIDHVMGLMRLFWIPDGATANEGAYVHYPRDDLFAVLALESHRARCLVVGEDLGTVAEGFRERMRDAQMLSYRVLWFERLGVAFAPPSAYPAAAAACVSTHDLPTVAGWWTGTDIAERQALGRIDADAAAVALSDRQGEKRALVAALDAAGVTAPAAKAATVDAAALQSVAITAAIHRFLGATPSALALVQADDLAQESVAINLPGTDRERPNWRRRIGIPAGELWGTPLGKACRSDFAARRDPGAAAPDPLAGTPGATAPAAGG